MDKSTYLYPLGDSIKTGGTECPELSVPDSVEIKSEYVLHGNIAMVDIRLKISYSITVAKNKLKELRERNTTNKHIQKYISKLGKTVALMKQFQQTYLMDEKLEGVYLIDLCSDERKIALQSYIRQKKYAEEVLKEREKNRKTEKKEILDECYKEVSLLLKENGLHNHKIGAYDLLVNNGLDIPISL